MQASAVRAVMHTVLGRGLTTAQVEQLAQASVSKKIAAGQTLMSEGERPSGLLFLLQGNVEIFKQGGDDAVGLQPRRNPEQPRPTNDNGCVKTPTCPRVITSMPSTVVARGAPMRGAP